MQLVDTHAHLDMLDDAPAAVERAADAGVDRIVSVGITAASSRAAVELAGRYAAVAAAVGIHPSSAAAAEPGDWERIVELAARPRVVAIGETGIDRHWDFTPLAVQQQFFVRHVELAAARGLPVIVHCREAEEDVLAVLRASAESHGAVAGVMHCFSGGSELARACLEMGMYLSFAGNVTYTNAKFRPLRDVAAAVPAERLLVETDAPYLTPMPLRGKVKNQPAYVAHTLAELARLRGVAAEELARQTTENARRLFAL